MLALTYVPVAIAPQPRDKSPPPLARQWSVQPPNRVSVWADNLARPHPPFPGLPLRRDKERWATVSQPKKNKRKEQHNQHHTNRSVSPAAAGSTHTRAQEASFSAESPSPQPRSCRPCPLSDPPLPGITLPRLTTQFCAVCCGQLKPWAGRGGCAEPVAAL